MFECVIRQTGQEKNLEGRVIWRKPVGYRLAEADMAFGASGKA